MESIHIKIFRGFSALLLASTFLITTLIAAWAGDYWAIDPKTGCQIGWVFEDYSLVSASWSGPVVDGKAEGKGILKLTVLDKHGKELRGQADAEMKAGKLDGKVTLKWSDGQYYDGFYKAGLKEGKGIYRWPDGRVYDGEWKAGKPINSQESIETESPQAGNAWIKITCDPKVSSVTRKNAPKAADITTALLDRYGMPLVHPVTAIITADTEAFLNAVISTGNMSRATAEKWFRGGNLGDSFGKKDTIVMRLYPIVIKGQPRQENNISEILTILPHEVFHQVQLQYSKDAKLAQWLTEGTAEYFRSLALEESGVVNVNIMLRYAEGNIRKAASIPDVHRLLDHAEYRTLAREDLPVYDMAQVMVSRLIADKDFRKVASFYKLLAAGTPPDKAFSDAFGVSMPDFLDEMNAYFKTKVRKE